MKIKVTAILSGMFMLALLIGHMEHAKADIVSINPIKDNTLYEDATGSQSNGAGTYSFAGRTAQGGDLRRGVIAFDIAGSVPAGSTINSVTLTLHMSRTRTAANQNVQLHKLLADWGEGTSNAGGQEGAGGLSATNDATWIHRFFNSSLWTNSGGDFSTTASATTAVGGVGFYAWGSTAQMVADIQEWLDTPSSNFGWLVLGNESANGTAKRFDTKENTVPANVPVLTVDYTPGVTSRIFFGVSPSCAGVGEMVTISADSTFGGQFYRYFVKPPGENFQVIQDWTMAKSTNWMPTQAGVYILIVWVSDDMNVTSPLGQIGGTYDVGGTDCPYPVRVSVTPASGVMNEAVTITAVAERSDLQYRLFVRSGDFRPPNELQPFVPMGDWTSNNVFQFTPASADIYTLIVQTTADQINPGSEPPPKPQGGMVYIVGQ